MYLNLSQVLATFAILSLANGQIFVSGGESTETDVTSVASTLATEFVVASTPNSPKPDVDDTVLPRDTKFCTNRRENINEGGCAKTKGFGYASAHNCKGGNSYSCKRGGNVECLTLKAAKKQGLEGGYCYTAK
ncbi:uncharacterized protein K452DRAFT_117074 [Aplosporella prunicola CBS 121167]|uniref:Uncharacterized protein n=1 Tax=Aplosporella prunicola CBS 121167 TaxID=1176127 RepID=A0A6A6AYR4_9PEZI|nr:uncharacterized protein K452DRAFT_117074 [Aplosporella prunicola CBS 121167]KAF2136920.1 hypothetical protein K452DRAFT_117074 [Aplosporella prunicola CBS 121167]